MARLREILIAEKYIECHRTPYGYRYTVRKSKKFGVWGGTKRSDNSVHSGSDNLVDSGEEIGQLCPERSDKGVRNKEDHVVDHVVKAAAGDAHAGDGAKEAVWGFLGENLAGRLRSAPSSKVAGRPAMAICPPS